MAEQVLQEELLARAVGIEGRKMIVSMLFGDQRVVESQASEMQHRHSEGFARKAFAGLVHEDCAVGRRRLRRVMERTRCWRTKPKWPKIQSCEKLREEVRKVKHERRKPVVHNKRWTRK